MLAWFDMISLFAKLPGQDTVTGARRLRVKLSPILLSATHGRGYTVHNSSFIAKCQIGKLWIPISIVFCLTWLLTRNQMRVYCFSSKHSITNNFQFWTQTLPTSFVCWWCHDGATCRITLQLQVNHLRKINIYNVAKNFTFTSNKPPEVCSFVLLGVPDQ